MTTIYDSWAKARTSHQAAGAAAHGRRSWEGGQRQPPGAGEAGALDPVKPDSAEQSTSRVSGFG
jgi:hypothetical protein